MPAVKQQEEPRHERGRVAWLAAAAVGSVALAVVVSLAGISLARSAAVRAKYEKVEVGMTLEQVEVILGEAGGDPGSQAGQLTGGLIACASLNSETVFWDFEDYAISVEFSWGVVREKAIQRAPRSWLERLKALWPF